MSVQLMRATIAGHDLLQHSFYQRWSRGELSLEELRDYACQYHHVVTAMPRWLGEMAGAGGDDRLEQHAREEAGHVALWEAFAAALGVTREEVRSASPNAATSALLRAGDELVRNGSGAAAVWALEAQAPAVSESKLEGLRRHYGIAGGPGTRYFEVHRALDVRHAAELEDAVAADPAAVAAAPAAAGYMAGRLWDLLSSVERTPARA